MPDNLIRSNCTTQIFFHVCLLLLYVKQSFFCFVVERVQNSAVQTRYRLYRVQHTLLQALRRMKPSRRCREFSKCILYILSYYMCTRLDRYFILWVKKHDSQIIICWYIFRVIFLNIYSLFLSFFLLFFMCPSAKHLQLLLFLTNVIKKTSQRSGFVGFIPFHMTSLCFFQFS